MATCDYCGTTILFGGVKSDNYRFCNAKCQQHGILLAIGNQVPDELVSEHLAEVHQSSCPKCGGPGPIDVHTSHYVWSALAFTSWGSRPQVCCRSCGVKAKIGKIFFSGIFGWWGFPWGLFVTPIQIGRNVVGLFNAPDAATPSPELEKIIRLNIASQVVANAGQQENK